MSVTEKCNALKNKYHVLNINNKFKTFSEHGIYNTKTLKAFLKNTSYRRHNYKYIIILQFSNV